MYQEQILAFLSRYYEESLIDFQRNYPDECSFYVNSMDIDLFSRELAEELLQNPIQFIEDGDLSLRTYLNEHNLTENANFDKARLRFTSSALVPKIAIRDLREAHIDTFISVEGMVRKVSPVRPRYTSIAFKCQRCEHITGPLPQPEDKMVEPYACEDESCGQKGPFKIEKSESTKIDYQRVLLQESPETVQGSSQPQELILEIEGDITGNISPGQRVIANGYIQERFKRQGNTKTPDTEISLKVNSIESIESDFEEIEITEEEEQQIIELSKDENIKQHIIESLIPAIHGYEDVKEALTYQLFSGVPKILPNGTRIRGDLHILLVGDPGTAKSQMLRSITKISPRAVFASGKGTSAAGLTATAVKDSFDNKWSLEAGALVMADMGIAAIDELDKMSDDDKSAFHEAMEQQSVTVAKAGIIASLKTRCGILGAANPKDGRFSIYDPISSQIDMPPALISRFDSIFVLMDTPNKETDSKIANHIIRTNRAGEMLANYNHASTPEFSKDEIDNELEPIKQRIETDILRKYVAYSRKNIIPVMTEEAGSYFVNYYNRLRNNRENKDGPIPVTARQLEALIRMGEASARIRLSNKITLDDAKHVCELSMQCAKKIGVDPETGQLDVDIIEAGNSTSQRDKIRKLRVFLQDNKGNYPGGNVPIDFILQEMESKYKIEKSITQELILKLKRSGDIYMPNKDSVRIV